MKGVSDIISKNKRFEIRLSEQEYQKIKANAQKAKLTVSQFTRRSLTGEVVQEAKPVEYFKLYNEINKIGVNINQIAKIANTTKSVEETSMKEIRYLLMKIYGLLDSGVT